MLKAWIVTQNTQIINLTSRTVRVNGVLHPPHEDHTRLCEWHYNREEMQGFEPPAPFYGKFELRVNEGLIESHISNNSVVLVDIMLFGILFQSSRHEQSLFQHPITGIQLLAGVADTHEGTELEPPEASIVTSFECVL
jgi:hypothetical protein